MVESLIVAIIQRMSPDLDALEKNDEDPVNCDYKILDCLHFRLISSRRPHHAPLPINYAGAGTLGRFRVARTI